MGDGETSLDPVIRLLLIQSAATSGEGLTVTGYVLMPTWRQQGEWLWVLSTPSSANSGFRKGSDVRMKDPIGILFKKVARGRAVLFLGAGASQVAGAPTGRELAAALQEEFIEPAISNGEVDLISVCTVILDTPGVDRKDLEEFIRGKLRV